MTLTSIRHQSFQRPPRAWRRNRPGSAVLTVTELALKECGENMLRAPFSSNLTRALATTIQPCRRFSSTIIATAGSDTAGNSHLDHPAARRRRISRWGQNDNVFFHKSGHGNAWIDRSNFHQTLAVQRRRSSTTSKNNDDPTILVSPILEKLQHLKTAIVNKSCTKAKLRSMAGSLSAEYRNLPTLKLHSPESCPRTQILFYLAVDCGPDGAAVRGIEELVNTDHPPQTKDTLTAKLARIRKLCTPLYETILALMMQQDAKQGLTCLLEMREDLVRRIPIVAAHSNDDSNLQPPESEHLLVNLKELDHHLQRNVLAQWMVPAAGQQRQHASFEDPAPILAASFSLPPPLLQVRRLTFADTSANILERIVRNEAVHPVASLTDLRLRLGPGRRVFALFHSCLPPDEPLVVLYVALLGDEAATSMRQIHSIQAEPHAKTAVFYSISNLRPGLTGLGLAEYLIHSAVGYLQQSMPSIETYRTLSPLPGFGAWLMERVSARDWATLPAPSPEMLSLLRGVLKETEQTQQQGPPATNDEEIVEEALRYLQRFDRLDENSSPTALEPRGEASPQKALYHALEPWLMQCAARYLARAKTESGHHHNNNDRPIDPVTRFHVGNGAILDDVFWNANSESRKGWNNFGIMCSYRYDLQLLEENQGKYHDSFHIPLSTKVEQLLDR